MASKHMKNRIVDLYDSLDELFYHVDTIRPTWTAPTLPEGEFLQNRSVYGGKDYKDPCGEEEDPDEVMADVSPQVEDENENADQSADQGGDDVDPEEQYEITAADMLKDLFGQTLDDRIKVIRSTRPISTPGGVTCAPHPHQLYAAARLAFLLRSPLQGAILADQMGLGKTISAILTMLKAGRMRGEGPVLIVTKKSIINHWINELGQIFDDEHKLKVLVITPVTTPHELYQYDVVITNFEAIRQQYNSMKAFADSFRDDAPPTKRLLPRPAAPVLSKVHTRNGILFRLVVDEAQFAKNYNSVTNKAIQAIPRAYTLLMSGTILDNDWTDIQGLLQLLSGHPFTSREFFIETFSSMRNGRRVTPTNKKTNRLVKFLQSMTLSRPDHILQLKDITFEDVTFELDNSEKRNSDKLVQKYMAAAKGGHDQGDASALTLLVQAMQESTHPELLQVSKEALVDELTGVAEDEEYEATTTRSVWLQRIREGQTALNSSRMKALKKKFEEILADDEYKEEHDRRRVVVTSASTKVLDIAALVLEDCGVDTLFFDGRTSTTDRTANLRQFQESTPGTTVLLLTPGAGGTGLNIPQASVLIQTEVWWNANTERQMHCRLRRPGQDKDIEVFRLFASNAKIDNMILLKQRDKSSRNNRIIQAITWHDEDDMVVPAI